METFQESTSSSFSTLRYSVILDVTPLIKHAKKLDHFFFLDFAFLIAKTARFIPELRYRYKDGVPFDCYSIEPSYVITAEESAPFVLAPDFSSISYHFTLKQFEQAINDAIKRPSKRSSIITKTPNLSNIIISRCPKLAIADFFAKDTDPQTISSIPHFSWFDYSKQRRPKSFFGPNKKSRISFCETVHILQLFVDVDPSLVHQRSIERFEKELQLRIDDCNNILTSKISY